jgi:serralysin
MCFVCQALSLSSSWSGIHDPGTATPFAEAAGSTSGSGTLASSASGAYLQGATGNQNIDGVLSGYKWTTTALTWRIPTSASQYDTNSNLAGIQYGDTTRTNTFLAPTVAMTTVVATILDTLFGAVSGLSFTQAAASDTSADMSIGRSTATASFGTAYAYYPTGSGTGLSGDSWFSDAYDSWGGGYAYDNPVKGGYAWATYIHEFGHNMGLKHGQETDGPANTAMAADRDGMEFSIMTYRSYVGGPTDGYTNEQWGFAQSLMMYDIAALQVMYGADFTTNAANSVYTFSPTTGQMFINGVGQGAPGGNRVFLTIWDGGGTDTFDFSNYTTNQSIDLTPGGWSLMSSVQQANLGGGNYARGNVYNALQSNGDVRSLIENAIGGSGNDTITGNAADNDLRGGAGNDTINGGDGNDTIIGGAGVDVVDGGNGIDTYAWLAGDAVVDMVAGTATWGIAETFKNIENISAGSGNDRITGDGSANRIDGGGGNDLILGGAGNDTINGGDGNDTIIGGAGVDVVDGGNGIDTYAWLAGDAVVDMVAGTATWTIAETFTNIENMSGGSGNDRITGDGNANRIEGGGGNDTINGGLGNDQLYGGTGDDTFIFTVTNFGTDTIMDFDVVGGDVVQFKTALFASFQAVMTSSSQVGSDTLITYSVGNTILLKNVDMASLTAGDFSFVA